jgi:hypothetical protein
MEKPAKKITRFVNTLNGSTVEVNWFLDTSSKKPRLKSYAVPSKNLPERKTFYDVKPSKQ